MIIEFGNLNYFYYIGVCALLTIFLMILFRNKSTKLIRTFIIILSFIGFILHFAKQIVYWDTEQLHKSTAENICALSTIILPWLLLRGKKKYNKSIMLDICILFGILGGIGAVIYPTEALGKEMFSFETLRFYFCHWSLYTIPLLMVESGLYKFKFKKAIFIPIGALIYEIIIALNAGLLAFTGLVKKDGYTAMQLFLSNKYINNSFAFGPTDDMGFLGDLFRSLIPNFMKFEYMGNTCYWPVICLIGPIIILIVPMYLILCIICRKKLEK